MGLMAKVSQTHLKRLLSCCHALSSYLWWGEDVSVPQVATSSILSSRNVRLFLVQYISLLAWTMAAIIGLLEDQMISSLLSLSH